MIKSSKIKKIKKVKAKVLYRGICKLHTMEMQTVKTVPIRMQLTSDELMMIDRACIKEKRSRNSFVTMATIEAAKKIEEEQHENNNNIQP
jgi:hypothetical protein